MKEAIKNMVKSGIDGNTPRVSLILTCYNSEKNLVGTLRSILGQTYENLEIVIVDGASTDRTVDVIKEFEKKYQKRYLVKWISERDNGIYDAMNKGYGLSTGEIIAFFNDVFLCKNAIDIMVNAIVQNKSDGSHADLVYTENGKVKRYWKMGMGKIRYGWMPGHPTLYLKREVYEKYGLYRTKYKCSADFEFMVRILRDNKVRLAYVPRTIISMYYGGTSTAGLSGYWVSVREAHQALVDNGVKGGWGIIILRTFRTLMQFVWGKFCKGVPPIP